MAAVSKNKPAWRCVQLGDSPYFSLKSSFTCSRRITFSPSLLASSSSAKQKRTGNKTPHFFLSPWKTHPTVTAHNRASVPLPQHGVGTARRRLLCACTLRHLLELCKVAIKCCQICICHALPRLRAFYIHFAVL